MYLFLEKKKKFTYLNLVEEKTGRQKKNYSGFWF